MKIKNINILSWGGGTQSTALLLKFMNKEIKDDLGNPIKLDYVIFADTLNESAMTYKQIVKVKDYVKKKYDFDIIITRKNIKLKPDQEIIDLIKTKEDFKYRNSEYADLYQSHILYFGGYLKSIDVMPFWTRNANGSVGKTPFKVCTSNYKIGQIMKELRIRENIKSFDKTKHHLTMFIGYSIDEVGRYKDNPLSYATNKSPLINMRISRQDCIDYVIKELGFKPRSSVCNMCYANDFKHVFDIYENDKEGWSKLLLLDNAMANKPATHQLNDDIFMFKFQADLNIRLKDTNMEELKEQLRSKVHQFDIFEMEQEMTCEGSCFI